MFALCGIQNHKPKPRRPDQPAPFTSLGLISLFHLSYLSSLTPIPPILTPIPAFRYLRTVDGIGEILALTIMLETGEIKRFAGVGNFASYCRCVGSEKLSNGKRKGSGNTKNGNKYLAWAFVEAANFAVRFNPEIRRFYQRKKAKTNGIVAIKAVAHKLARACYHIIKDQVPFDIAKAFARTV